MYHAASYERCFFTKVVINNVIDIIGTVERRWHLNMYEQATHNFDMTL